MKGFISIAIGILGLYSFDYTQAISNDIADYGRSDINRRICQSIVEEDFHEVCRLIGAGADVNAKDEEGKTLLAVSIWDCLYASYEMVDLLIDNGADVNMPCDYNRLTPLHWALIRDDDVDMVSLLVRNGADVNAEDMCGRTPFDYADEYDLSSRLLTRHDAHNGRNRESTLMIRFFDSVDLGLSDMTASLLRDNPNININHRYGRRQGHRGMTALELAVSRGNINAVRMLLDNNATVTPSAREEATRGGFNEILNLLNQNRGSRRIASRIVANIRNRCRNQRLSRITNIIANIRNRH